MVVDRFQDRLPSLERPHLVLHEGEVVGARVECGESDRIAFAPVERVIVIQADCRYAFAPEQTEKGGHERRFARAAVAAQADEYRAARGAGLGHHTHTPSRKAAVLAFSPSRSCANDSAKSFTPFDSSSLATDSILIRPAERPVKNATASAHRSVG